MDNNTVDIPAAEPQENIVPPAETINPIEQYNFCFTKKDGEFFYSDPLRRLIIRTVIFSVFLILLSIDDITVTTNGVTSAYPAAPVFLSILALYLIIKSVFIIRMLKHRKLAGERLDGAAYRYNFFPTHIEVIRTKDGEPETTEHFDFRDIKKFERKENYIRILANNKFILLKENEISPGSPFLYYINTSPLTKNLKTQSKYYVVSIILFFAALCSLFLAATTVLPATGGRGSELMWLFYLFIPIPLSSLIFGIYATKKGFRATKNIIIGILMSFILFMFGNFSFLFNNMMLDDPGLYIETEELTGIDLPDYTMIATNRWKDSWTDKMRGNTNIRLLTSSEITITNLSSESFRSRLLRDDRWLSEIPDELKDIVSASYDNTRKEYILIFNVNTGEYNTPPAENGCYRFINIVFKPEFHFISIVDYEIEYTK